MVIKLKVWLLRVYKLDKPILTKRSNGMVFANTNKKISLSNMKPVISDVEFNKIKEDIIDNNILSILLLDIVF